MLKSREGLSMYTPVCTTIRSARHGSKCPRLDQARRVKRNGVCGLARSASRASFFGPIPQHRALATRVPPDHATTLSRGTAGSAAVRTAQAAAHTSNDLVVHVRVEIVGGHLGGDLYTGGTRRAGPRRLTEDPLEGRCHDLHAPPRPALHALFPRLPIGPALVLACDKRDRPRAPGPPRLQYSTIPGVSAPWKGRPTRRRSTCMAARTV